MKKKILTILITIFIVCAMSLCCIACSGATGPQGPQGLQGVGIKMHSVTTPAGYYAVTPRDEDLTKAVVSAAKKNRANKGVKHDRECYK